MTDPEPPRGPIRRRRRTIAVVATVIVLVVAGVVVARRLSDEAAKQEAAEALSTRFAAAWANDDFTGISFVGRSDTEVNEDYVRLTDGLGEFAVTTQPLRTQVVDERAVTTMTVDWTLVGDIHWTIDTRIELERSGEQWQVVWTPTIVHPDLTADTRLIAERVQPVRGQIYGAGDQILVTDRAVVEVGIQPNKVTDLPALAATLESVLGVKAADLEARVRGAKPDAFVAVLTLRRTDYDPIREQIQPLPGTVFRERSLPLGPSRTFARALLGTSGDVTAEVIEGSGGRYRVGDVAGLSGMQQRYDSLLAGVPGARVYVTNAPPSGADAPEGSDAELQLDVVFEAPPIDGGSVRTTIDAKVQFAADDAIAELTQPSSLVVVRPSTGEVLAVSNGPDGGGENLAFTGQYPPGSAFKVVSTEALLGNRLSIGEVVDCPAEVTADGREFRNAEYASLGRVPFRQAFYQSCNTAFVNLSDRLDADALTEAGARFGIGGSWTVGMPAFTGSIPATEGRADHVSAMLGQGRVLVSPLAMAMMAATVDEGVWRPPVLVREPKDSGPVPAPSPLPAGEINTLQTLMREVVTEGTGWRAQNTPGPPVSGKTGTAEFGTDDPPRSHAWFVGYQGDIAFALIVEGGEFGGETAVPIARDLLTRLQAEAPPA
jgi:cell division protein FtsI/penicillin-binding protein 2